MANPVNVSDVITDVNAAVNGAYRISQAVSKTSVTRLTKDQVFQFPIYMDGSIDDDEQYPIIKCIEKNYAQLITMAITNDGLIDRDRYSDVNQFLRKFHNNNGIPVGLASESVSVSANLTSKTLSSKDILAMQGALEDRLDIGSINNMYKPYMVTQRKLTNAIESAMIQRRKTAALEADAMYFRRPVIKRDKAGKQVTSKSGGVVFATDSKGSIMYEYIDAGSNTSDPQYGEAHPLSFWERTDAEAKARINFDSKAPDREYEETVKREERRLNTFGKIGGQVVKDDKYANMAPTVINMTLANTQKGVGAWSQNLIIGVKAVARMIPQSLMVNNMVDACKNRAIFTFIKWTNHELKFLDLFFGINSARANARGDNRWLKVLRRRAMRSRIPGAKINPNTTIIITDADVHLIREQCGVDLSDLSNVRKIMEKYFLLGFGIYDTEGKMLKIIYDGEQEFTQHSMRSLMADAKKEANLLAVNRY